MANDIKLQESHPVDENLRPLKVGGKSTAIETAQHGYGSRINGDLEVTGDIKGNVKDVELDLTTINSTDLTIDDSGDITLDAAGGDVTILQADLTIPVDKKVIFGNTGEYIVGDDADLDIVSSGRMTNTVTGAYKVDSGSSIILDSATGAFQIHGAGTTSQFSVDNSAFAGMILGYRCIGEDAIHASYTLTTSFAVPNSDMTVRFIAPPSGAVEIMVQIWCNASTSNRVMYFGLSDNSTYNTIGVEYEQLGYSPDETDDNMATHRWTVSGLTAGDTYNYWFGAKISGTTGYLNWGGNASGRYPVFIMKATALPTATADFAVYG